MRGVSCPLFGGVMRKKKDALYKCGMWHRRRFDKFLVPNLAAVDTQFTNGWNHFGIYRDWVYEAFFFKRFPKG